MRAIRHHEHGGTEVLQVDEVDRPDPDVNEVLVETKAIGLNHVDTLFREGIFQPASLPAIPGSDFAGIIAAVGDCVTEFEVGDRVHGAGLGGNIPGSYAEYVTAPKGMVVHLPEEISFEKGAAMGHVGIAAWHAVVNHGDLEPGQTCLIHGGGGGVGHIAVQIADAAGATVITTGAEESTRDKLEEIGADYTFDYRREDLAEAITSVANPDLIVDCHFDNYIQFDILSIAHGGRICVIEYSAEEGSEATLPQSTLRAGLMKDVDIQLIGVYNADISIGLKRLGKLAAQADLQIEIAATYDLEDAAQAQEELVNKTVLGSRVLIP
jgi:NADPH2:quinone reductase